jgi:hypothetical protein
MRDSILASVGWVSGRSARVFASLPLTCPNYGADMRIVTFITEATPV